MAKTLNRELSQSPYFTRDIHEAFSKILFRPGLALQSAELIELQDIVQNQIKRLSNHIFQDGSIVFGKGILEPKLAGLAKEKFNCYLFQLNDGANTELFLTKGSQVQIRRRTTTGLQDIFQIEFITFNEAFYDEENNRYYPTLLAAKQGYSALLTNDEIYFGQQLIGTIQNTEVLKGRYVSIEQSSMFYVSGYFVALPPEDYIFAIDEVDSFDTQVGIEVAQEIITVDDMQYGSKLLDPAQNSFNANSPGADRLKLALQLTHYPLNYTFTDSEWKFYPLIKYDNGTISYRANFPIYSELGDTLARRTSEINGNFVVDDFDLTVNEASVIGGTHTITDITPVGSSNIITITGTNTNYRELEETGNLDPHYLMLGNEIAYHRLFRLTQVSSNNEIKVSDEHYDRYLETDSNFIDIGNIIQIRNERYLNFVLDPGIAYVDGYRFQTTFDQYIERKKARNWELSEGDDIYQNKQYFVANTVDVHFMNEGQAFQNLDYVDVHVGNKNQIHFPNTATTYTANTANVTANSISSNTITIFPTSGIFNTTGLKNWDYVNVYDNSGKFIEETLIYNVESLVDTEAFIDVIDGTKYTLNGFYQIEKVSSEDKEKALYNSTNFGKLRLHTSVVSGSETELHYSHWLKEPSKVFTVTQVTEDLANTVVSLRAKTMSLSEQDDVYNDLRIYKGEESWKVTDYTANNAYKEFKLEVSATNYLNPITIGESLELRYETEQTARSLAQLARDYNTNFKANLNVANSRLNIQTPNGTNKRFNVICSEEQEVKSVVVNDYKAIFYDTFSVGSAATNFIFGNINSHFSSTAIPSTNVSVYSKNDILDATNSTVEVAAGEKVDVASALINATSQLEITLVNTYRANSEFIVHAVLPIQTPQRRSKTLISNTMDEFRLDFDANGAILNSRYNGGGIFMLTYPDIYRVREILVGVNKTSDNLDSSFNDMTSYFNIDNGQRDTHYDLGTIHLKSHLSLPIVGPTDWLFFRVKYEHFEPGIGHYFTVNSYTDIHYRNIPTYVDENQDHYPLRNLIDYRPVRRPFGSANEFENEFALYDKVDFNYDYYYDQRKASYIHKHNQSTLEPISLDIAPEDIYLNSTGNDKIHLYDITVPAFTFDVYETYLRMIDNRGYTMKDISKLQKRLENLEDVVQLNSLELQTLQAKTYTATGDPAFANGLLVDMFAGFSIAKFEESGFQASVDLEQMELHPAFDSYAEKLKFIATTNVEKKNNVLFLPKTDVSIISELSSASSGAVSIGGISPVPKLSLHPFCNIWYDQHQHVKVKSNEDNQYKNWKSQSTKSGHGTQWADWEQFWSGVAAEDSTTSLGAPLLSLKTNRILNNKNNIQRVANGRKVNTTLAYPNAQERIGFVGEMLTTGQAYSLDEFTIQNGARLTITYTGADLTTLQRNYLYREIYQNGFPQNSSVVQKIAETGTNDEYYFYITNITSFIPAVGMNIQGFTGSITAVNLMEDSSGNPMVDDQGVACGDFVLTKITGDKVAVNVRYLNDNTYIVAAAEFHSAGLLSTIESLSKSIRPVQRKIYEQTKQIKYIEDQTNIIHAADDIPIPMHQPFILAEACMISRISVQITSGAGKFITTIRPFVNGNLSPSTILPFSEQVVQVTAAGSLDIVYDVPVYVPANQVYAITFASSDTIAFDCFSINEHTQLLYSLKEERNSSTVETETTRRLRMDLYKAQFEQNEKQFTMALANTIFEENIDQVRLNLNTLNTLTDQIEMKFEWKAKNYDSASNDSYYSPIDLNKTIQLPTRKEINSNTLQMNVSMKTNDVNFSPMLDLERFYMTMIRHSIDRGEYDNTFVKCHAKANTFAVTLEEYTKVGHIDVPAGREISFKVTNGLVSDFVSDQNFLLDNKTYLASIDEIDSAGITTPTTLQAHHLIDELYSEYNDKVKGVTDGSSYRYYSPIVTLEDNFEAMQIHFQTDAILKPTAEMYVYYRVKEVGMTNFEEYEKMNLITTTANKYSTDNRTKLLEFNTQRPVTSSRFKQFQIKIRFVSSDYVNAPTLKNIRIIALDN